MGNDHQRALKALQGNTQRMAHFQIKVIGRLIEQQQIWFLANHCCQHQARLFAAGQRTDRTQRGIT